MATSTTTFGRSSPWIKIKEDNVIADFVVFIIQTILNVTNWLLLKDLDQE